MNRLFDKTLPGENCPLEEIDKAVDLCLAVSNDSYEVLFYLLPQRQKELILAIAIEWEAKNVVGGDFVKKYRLHSASSVSSAAKGLLERNLITFSKGVYSVSDLFFALWLQRFNKD